MNKNESTPKYPHSFTFTEEDEKKLVSLQKKRVKIIEIIRAGLEAMIDKFKKRGE